MEDEATKELSKAISDTSDELAHDLADELKGYLKDGSVDDKSIVDLVKLYANFYYLKQHKTVMAHIAKYGVPAAHSPENLARVLELIVELLAQKTILTAEEARPLRDALAIPTGPRIDPAEALARMTAPSTERSRLESEVDALNRMKGP